MGKSTEDMYKSIIDGTSLFEEYNSLLMDYPSTDDDEMETFLTDDDIEKSKKKLEKEKKDIYDIQPGDGTIEEDVHFKRYTKRREHKYTEKEMEEIRNSCEATIVHDYGEYDIYHMSEEDRKKNDMLAEISIKLGKLKRTYGRVNEYIEAMRTVFEAWDLLEKSNYIHTKDEFYEMIKEGHIVSNRIIMPKLRRMDSYNIDLLIQYISNPELDPNDLVPVNNSEDDPVQLELKEIYENYKKEYMYDHEEEYKSKFTEKELEENIYDIEEHLEMESHRYAIDRMEEDDMARLLSPEETQYMIDHISDPEEIRVENINRKMIKDYDKRSVFSYRKKNKNRKKKKDDKKKKYVIENLHDILNKIQMNSSTNKSVTRSYMLTHNMFNYEQKEETVWDSIPYFDGSWADENAAILYDINLREELLNLRPEGNRYSSYGDLELHNFFRILEDNGINVVELRTKINGSQEYNENKELKERKKENKKIENAIIQRITNLNSNPKFKKLVNKAEKALNKQIENY